MEGKQKSLYNRQRIQRGAYDGHTQERNYKNAAAVLWHKFLLAETVNDIILSEIKDRLYLQNVDEDWLMSPETSPRDTFMARVTDLAFGDVVEEAVTSLYENKEALLPYSDLTEAKDPSRLYDLMMETAMGQLTCQDRSTVKKNPYYERIHISSDKENCIALTTADYLPYEFFQTFHRYKKENPFLYGEAGFFKERMTFPVILENNRVWMSVVPSEIRSMEKDIEAAKGKVITYGLGLGYYAFMASEKEEVESVTIVEMNRDVISLFKRNILPQFPNKEKIRIIEADAFAFIEKQEDGGYDTAFSDFWSSVDDGLDLYLRFMAKQRVLQKQNILTGLRHVSWNIFPSRPYPRPYGADHGKENHHAGSFRPHS